MLATDKSSLPLNQSSADFYIWSLSSAVHTARAAFTEFRIVRPSWMHPQCKRHSSHHASTSIGHTFCFSVTFCLATGVLGGDLPNSGFHAERRDDDD